MVSSVGLVAAEALCRLRVGWQRPDPLIGPGKDHDVDEVEGNEAEIQHQGVPHSQIEPEHDAGEGEHHKARLIAKRVQEAVQWSLVGAPAQFEQPLVEQQIPAVGPGSGDDGEEDGQRTDLGDALTEQLADQRCDQCQPDAFVENQITKSIRGGA
ncbi:hypothetical protein AERO8C_90012 [Aeromonas veronii]|uniref:Uncharacterized protein n=1 Tax=Aeromonas veronii TaxID=654 RepID=A0A653LEQ7_AERVE|nr:hypothetical protein AERO8C_90012 [Aeromonas veronii]